MQLLYTNIWTIFYDFRKKSLKLVLLGKKKLKKKQFDLVINKKNSDRIKLCSKINDEKEFLNIEGESLVFNNSSQSCTQNALFAMFSLNPGVPKIDELTIQKFSNTQSNVRNFRISKKFM